MNFEQYLLPEFITLVEQIHNQGFKVGVIGGTVRDFFLEKKKSLDYDCELRLINLDGDIQKSFSQLQFDKDIKVTKLPYEILRLEHKFFTCELSMPRVELFNNEFNHSNFEAVFSNNLDYAESAKRRDFTINAMMYEFNGHWEFIDPCLGQKDLGEKLLRPCSPDFFQDPVRYLRALRFSRNLGFTIDQEILVAMSELGTEVFSSHYLRQEALKTGKPVSFILDLVECLVDPIESIFRDFLEEIEENVLDIKKHLSGLLFIEPELRDLIFEMFDYSLKIEFLCFPLEFNSLKKMSVEELERFDEENNLLNTIKQVKNLDEKYYSYLYDLEVIDFDFQEFHQLNSIPVDISEVENAQKRFVQLYKRLVKYFDS
ncbi:MAG: hypothetical protein ACJAS4_000048 [Bacteriovoracaceae bacterium]|jgi:hypothetical protein